VEGGTDNFCRTTFHINFDQRQKRGSGWNLPLGIKRVKKHQLRREGEKYASSRDEPLGSKIFNRMRIRKDRPGLGLRRERRVEKGKVATSTKRSDSSSFR